MKYTPWQYLKLLYYWFANPARTAYRFIFRPTTVGVKCLVVCDGEFLLVRHNYGHGAWTIPGGGVERGESFEEATKRELFEETGIVATTLQKLGEYASIHRYHTDVMHAYCYHAQNKMFKVDGWEIAEAQWVDRYNLPAPHRPIVDVVLSEYRISSTPTQR